MEKIKIAIADDHTLVRKGFISILQAHANFDVVADASNGKDLIRQLSMLEAPADICLLDVNMPILNGYDALVQLKSVYPDMRFLILTQLEHEFIIIKMLKAGASGYMLKNTEPEELITAVMNISEEPSYGSKLVNGKLLKLVQQGKDYNRFSLSDAEQEFLRYCCTELTYKEIATKMDIPERRVAFYRQSMFDKLEVVSRTGLALYALKFGLVPVDEMDQLPPV